MRSFFFKALLFLLAIQLLCADAQNQKDEILSKIYDAYGGKSLLLSVKGVIQKGSGFSAMKNESAKVTRIYKNPLKLKMIKEFKDSSETRIVTEKAGFRDAKEVTGILKESMLLQAGRILMPKLMLENPQNVAYLGEKEMQDSKKWHIFSYKFDSGSTLLIQVDTQTYIIEATTGTLYSNGRPMQFITTYSLFKKFDGILMAAKEVHYAMGRYVGFTMLEQVEFSDTLKESLFNP